MRLFRRGERSGSSGRLPQGNWRKPTRSWANSDCVEVGQFSDGVVGVRDSKSAEVHVLAFGVSQWSDFVADVRSGRFPLWQDLADGAIASDPAAIRMS